MSCSKCLTVDVSIAGAEGQRHVRGLTLEEEKTFKDAFAAVMVDTTLGFNVFGVWGRAFVQGVFLDVAVFSCRQCSPTNTCLLFRNCSLA